MQSVCQKSAHYYRFWGLAIVDVIMTIIAAAMISYVFQSPFLYTSIFLFVLGILLHRLFCVRTTIDKILFPNAHDDIYWNATITKLISRFM